MATSKKAAGTPRPAKANENTVAKSAPKPVATKTAESGSENIEKDFLWILEYVFKLYNESLEALKLNLVTFIMLALVPVGLAALAIPFVILPILTKGGFVSILISAIVLLILFVIGCIFLPALTITQLESAKGNKIEFKDAFEKSKPVVLPYIGLTLLSALIIGFGFILLIIPGLIAAFFLSLSAYILVDKKLGVIDSISASFELVKTKWQWVASVFIIQMAISAISPILPPITSLLAAAASIIYYCLPAIVYLKITKK